MDNQKTGLLIKELRQSNNWTQKELAEKLNISDKTISKWERGVGLPDVLLLNELSKIFETNVNNILEGNMDNNTFVSGNMKKCSFFVCPICGNITVCSGNSNVMCCGKMLKKLNPEKASDNEKLNVEKIENEWFISSNHKMTKKDYISFIALATGDRLEIIKQYPEWDLSSRLSIKSHGILFWYCSSKGLQYMSI